jgi:hypothetical protein
VTWTQQVWHVAWKDLRHTRWFMALYAVMVLIAAVLPRDVIDRSEMSWWTVQPFLLLVVVAAMIAVWVHNDSPALQDAGWRALPLSPTAIVAAKFVALGALAVVGLVGQTLRMRDYALATPQLLTVLISSTVALVTAALGFAIVAAVTRSLLSTLLTLVAYLVVSNTVLPFFVSLLGKRHVGIEGIDDGLPVVVFAALVAGGLIALYRRPRGAVSQWAIMLVLLVVPPVVSQLAVWQSLANRMAPSLPSTQSIGATTSLMLQLGNVESAAVALDLRGFSPTEQVMLEQANIILRFGSADSVIVPFPSQFESTNGAPDERTPLQHVTIREPLRIPGTSLRWPEESTRSSLWTSLRIAMNEGRRQQLQRGAVTAYVVGTLRAFEATQAASLPDSVGASVVSAGARLALRDTMSGAARWERVLRFNLLTTLYHGTPQGAVASASYQPRVLLLNERIGLSQAISLASGHSTMASMVMFGAGATSGEQHLQLGRLDLGGSDTAAHSAIAKLRDSAGSRLALIGFSPGALYGFATAPSTVTLYAPPSAPSASAPSDSAPSAMQPQLPSSMMRQPQ